jgi:polyhydroxyalkanoate synthase subunit PhaC
MPKRRNTPPPPLPRNGPTPLPLHLMAAATLFWSSPSVWQNWNSASQNWKVDPAQKAKLQANLKHLPSAAVETALAAEAFRRFAGFLEGVQQYRAAPFAQPATASVVLWQKGCARLLDYGPAAAPPLLIVPSLINRPDILDFSPKKSFIADLRQHGYRPLLLDWGTPGEEEANLDLTQLIQTRLIPALKIVAKQGPVPVIGYCMGGVLATAAAVLCPHQIRQLVLIATPWDFQAPTPNMAQNAATMLTIIAPYLAAGAHIPASLLRAFFSLPRPFEGVQKFAAFAAAATPQKRQDFIRIEDWLNNGPPLPPKIADACLRLWYIDNAPAHGLWQVGKKKIQPHRIQCPSLIVAGQRDRLVPIASARTLADHLGNPTILSPSLGHIGLMTGDKVETEVWQPIRQWLSQTSPR